MSEELKTILTWIATLVVVTYWGIAIYKYWELRRFQKSIPTLSTEELICVFKEKGVIFSAGVLTELEKRKVDMSFAIPRLIDEATGGKAATRILAWGSIERYFPEVGQSIEYNPLRPSKEDKAVLREIKCVGPGATSK